MNFSSFLTFFSVGGWIGYFSYDTVRYAEKRKFPFSKAPKDDRGLPDMHLGLYNDVVVFDTIEKVHIFFLYFLDLNFCMVAKVNLSTLYIYDMTKFVTLGS